MREGEEKEGKHTLNTAMHKVSSPFPGRTLMTPGGNPALADSSANFMAVRGVTCEGGEEGGRRKGGRE